MALSRRQLLSRGLVGGAAAAAGTLLGPGRALGASYGEVYPLDPGSNQQTWAFGDSITWGSWLPEPARDNWVARVNARVGGDACEGIANYAVGGSCLVSYPTLGNVGLDQWAPEQISKASTPPKLALIAIGVNDLTVTDDTGMIQWAYYDLAGKLVNDLGVGKVIFCTILPYAQNGTTIPNGWLGALESRRYRVNTWLREMFAPLGMLWDRGGLLEASGSPYMDARYNVGDGLHPNQWGQLILSDAFDLSLLP